MNLKWIPDALDQKRISQSKLAGLIDLDKASLSKTIRGQRRLQVDEAFAIAQILGISITDFLRSSGMDCGQTVSVKQLEEENAKLKMAVRAMSGLIQ